MRGDSASTEEETVSNDGSFTSLGSRSLLKSFVDRGTCSSIGVASESRRSSGSASGALGRGKRKKKYYPPTSLKFVP